MVAVVVVVFLVFCGYVAVSHTSVSTTAMQIHGSCICRFFDRALALALATDRALGYRIPAIYRRILHTPWAAMEEAGIRLLFLRVNLLLGRPRWVVLEVPLDVSLLSQVPPFFRTCTPLPAASCYPSAPLPARGSTCRSGLSIPHHIVRTPPIGRGSRTAVRGILHTPAVLSRGPRDAASEPRCTTHWRAKGRRGGSLSSQGASAYGRP